MMAKKVKDAIDTGAKQAKSAADKAAKRAKDATDKAAEATKKAADRAAKAAKDVTDKAASRAKSAAEGVERIGASVKASGEKLKSSGEKLVKQGSAVSLKVIEHAESNTREAFAAMRAAAGAKTPAEVAKIQGDYLRDQGARALAHAREVGELILQFGRDAVGSDEKKS
jgi:Phasin protein